MTKILFAEDDKFMLQVYGARIRDLGIETILLESGLNVLAKVKEEKPDLICLDYIMPEHDGAKTLKQLKEDPETKDIPVVMISIMGTKEDIQKMKDMGASDYITKNVSSFEDIIKKIGSYVNLKTE